VTVPLLIGGLDPSTKRIGYCDPTGRCHSITSDKLPPHPSPMHLAARCAQLRYGLAATIRRYPPVPDLMVIEGPFFAHAQTSARLDELRGVIRELLVTWTLPDGRDCPRMRFVEIPPKSLKLFATGKSDADKTTMTHTAVCRIQALDPAGPVPANDDEGDSWHLRSMGRVALGLDRPWAEFQWTAIENCGVPW
jgi:Holliday junction resolvasome RuvABC endonuclease subunit